MAKSIFTPQYDRLRALLVESRKLAGLTQAALADCLRRPQSYVSKYERGERRLDVVEFLEIATCVHVDGPALLRSLVAAAKPNGTSGTNGEGKPDGQLDGKLVRAEPRPAIRRKPGKPR